MCALCGALLLTGPTWSHRQQRACESVLRGGAECRRRVVEAGKRAGAMGAMGAMGAIGGEPAIK